VHFSELQKPLDLVSGRGHVDAHIRSMSAHIPNYIEIRKTLWTYGWTDTPDFSKSIGSSHSDDLKVSDEVLVWLSVWSEVQWFAYGQADSTATPHHVLLH